MAEDQNPRQFTRRKFLKGAAAGAVLGAAAVSLAGCSLGGSNEAAGAAGASGLPDKWDQETDVVVLGTGTVFPAALVAKDTGSEVLMLEKAGNFGGTTALSGGGIWIPNNPVFEEKGIEDSKEAAFTYLQYVSEGQSDDDRINAFLDNGPEMLQWLTDHANFQWALHAAWPNVPFPEYYNYPGAHPVSRTVYPAQGGGGAALMQQAKEEVEKRGIEVLYNTPGKKLIVNPAGEVVGVVAESGDQEINIKARKGVIIGTGGFDYNFDMLRHYLRGPVYFTVSVPTNTGDGHLMGMALGAALGNMSECWGLPGYRPNANSFAGLSDWQTYRGKPGTITVNKHGERFYNESGAYDPAIRGFYQWDTGNFEWRNIPAFAIFGSEYLEHYALPGSKDGAVPDWMVEADTLDELAEKLGIDAEGLKAQVERFNQYAADGVDPEWHRGETNFDKWTAGAESPYAGSNAHKGLKNSCLAPITAPFVACNIWPGTCGTNGGLMTNTNAQVMNVWGQPIPRLYATSNAMASVFGTGYAGGGATLANGMTFGYIAGKHAVTNEPWS